MTTAPLPAGFGVRLDPWTMTRDGGVLLGGAPFQIVRLSLAHLSLVESWQAGSLVDDDGGALARALVAAGLAQPVPPSAAVRPSVSVVVPVKDRPGPLARLLRAIRDAEATDPVHEIVVVDDGSADPRAHAEVAAAAGATLVRRAVCGRAAAARNDGAAAASGQVLAFVDSDCVPRPGWLAALLPHFADPLVAAVAPRIVAHGTPEPGWLAAYESARSPLDRGPLPGRVVPGGRVPFVPTAALLVRATAFGAGFDTRLVGGEDVDFVWRLTAAGAHVRYEPAGEVAHEHRTTFREFVARRVYYGRTAAPLARRHPGAARPLAVSPWTAAAWAAVALRRPLLGAAITGVATGLLARDLRGVLPDPADDAITLAGGGTLRAGEVVADAAVRAWWPLAVAAFVGVPRLRPAIAVAAVVPALLEWRRERPPLGPLQWLAARRLDDAAYGWGVWTGSLDEGLFDALRPDLGWTLRIIDSDELLGASAD
ncbi:MAG TPA: mycofactocin biosynthesis glycosyltransferase MftF [Asanoa sp.]|nr:mycofactocin biosynthesis glycosyltransferase MftF [Asanoa sp.]